MTINNGVMPVEGTAELTQQPREEPSNEQALLAALEVGVSEIPQLSTMGSLDALAADLDIAPLGVGFDASETEYLPAGSSDLSSSSNASVGGFEGGRGVGGIEGGEELFRNPSFGIMGHAAASSSLGRGEPISRQSSLDMNIIMQVKSFVSRWHSLYSTCLCVNDCRSTNGYEGGVGCNGGHVFMVLVPFC